MGRLAPKRQTLSQSSWLTVLQQRVQHLWLLPDKIGWLSPLPPFHRRCFIVITLVVLLALLWPYPESKEHAPLPIISNNSVAIKNNVQNIPATNLEKVDNTSSPWASYRIKQGQTLTQLFRVHGLNVNDVFAMAQVEGQDKPLSTLKIGQEVKIQHNQNGQVITLQIEKAHHTAVLFRRNSDGRFQRLR